MISAAAFKNMFFQAGKGLSRSEAAEARGTISKGLARQLGALEGETGHVLAVDSMKLTVGKHGRVKFKVKATTYKDDAPMIAKLKGWLTRKGNVKLDEPKLKHPPKAAGVPDIESGGVFSRPTGGWNAYENLAEQSRIGF